MADFRGTNRIRKILAAARQTFRFVQFAQRNGNNGTGITAQKTHSVRKYRKPIIIASCSIAAVIAAGVIGFNYVEANKVDYYQVLVNGEVAGEISSQEKVDQLIADKIEELKHADTPAQLVLNDNQVTFAAERAYKKQTDDEATLNRLEGMLKTHAVGVKVVVEGEVVGVVRDEATAKKLLQRVKNKYAPARLVAKQGDMEVRSLSVNAAGADEAKAAEDKPKRVVTAVSFAEKVETVEDVIDAKQLSDPEELFKTLTEGEPIPRTYTVKKGDCIGCIAAKLNISEELIYTNNKWIKNDFINIGDVLDLSQEEPPILNVNSEEEVTEIEVIEPPIEYQKSDSMKLGQQKVLKEGNEGSQQVTYKLLKRNGALIEEEQIARQVLIEPIPTVILKGTKVIRGVGSGKFIWPVSGARITSYMGKRWGRSHNGIDMIGKSNIMAADEGVVEFAGYKSGGLGNAVIIDHGNGFKTTYGHMKSVKVKKGQVVEKGDSIGVMGSTGRSTGTHLHFEVHLNGKLKNPTSYL